jgi:hypothetical protein
MNDTSTRRRRHQGIEELHAAILKPWTVEADAAAALQRCLTSIPDRLIVPPQTRRLVTTLLERLLRLAAIGVPWLYGTPQIIDHTIATHLDEPELGGRAFYIALRALLGHTALVERPSRQAWKIRLREACVPSSVIHRKILAETPRAVVIAPTVAAPVSPTNAPPSELGELRAQLVALRQELEEERRRRVAAEEALHVALQVPSEPISPQNGRAEDETGPRPARTGPAHDLRKKNKNKRRR